MIIPGGDAQQPVVLIQNRRQRLKVWEEVWRQLHVILSSARKHFP